MVIYTPPDVTINKYIIIFFICAASCTLSTVEVHFVFYNDKCLKSIIEHGMYYFLTF